MTEQSQPLGLASETFTLTLDKVIKSGPSQIPLITKAICKFSYIWDFPRQIGSAELLTIDGVDVELRMFPLGIVGQLDFMNTDRTTVRLPGGRTITLDRVILDLFSPTIRKAAIMIEEGEEILATQNWEADVEATVAMGKRDVVASS